MARKSSKRRSAKCDSRRRNPVGLQPHALAYNGRQMPRAAPSAAGLDSEGASLQTRGRLRIATLCTVVLGFLPTAGADVLPSQVLVVFNSASAEAVSLKNSFLSLHP